MKAAYISRYGSQEVLQYGDVPEPSIKANQMLVKVYASSINPIDWKIRNGMLQVITGYNFPLILGFDVAGEVAQVGSKVTKFSPGDAIYAYLDYVPGGGYAEYVAVSEKAACHKPSNISYEEAAAVPLAGLTSWQAWRELSNLQSGQQVLVNGASGGVGSFAVQIAKALGARVTGVCSGQNLEFVRSLGADEAIDYTSEDVTQKSTQYDIIFDTVAKLSFARCQSILTAKGTYIATLPSIEVGIQIARTTLWPFGKKSKLLLSHASGEQLAKLKELIEAERVRPAIAQVYPLSEIRQAHAESERGKVRGKLVLRVAT
jgi:NADPH:quinone reductase-like Zn-dependent oxidoreductase